MNKKAIGTFGTIGDILLISALILVAIIIVWLVYLNADSLLGSIFN